MEELFPLPDRLVFRNRLEEMAFIFFRQGEEDYARRCLCAAKAIDREDGPGMGNRVIEFFLERNFSCYMEMIPGGVSRDTKQAEEARPGIILP